MHRIIAVTLAVAVTGCSFLFTTGPGNVGNPPQAYPDCTDSMTWPIVDGVIAASVLLSGIGVFGATHDSTSSTSTDGGAAATASAVLTAVAFGAGAYVGYGRVSRCRDVHEQFIAGHPNGMLYGGGAPQGYVPQAGPAVGAQNGYCTAQNTCDQGLVCSGMPDHTNRCIVGQTLPPPAALGIQGGACTAQLTCNDGLVCAGMPDHTNRCMPAPALGTQGGGCTAQLTCNTGLVCAGMPDHTNKCMPQR